MKKLKRKNLSFKEYYNSLRKTPFDFIVNLAKECGVTERTIYNWISGDIIPDKSHQDKIAEITGIPAKYLFKQIGEE